MDDDKPNIEPKIGWIKRKIIKKQLKKVDTTIQQQNLTKKKLIGIIESFDEEIELPTRKELEKLNKTELIEMAEQIIQECMRII